MSGTSWVHIDTECGEKDVDRPVDHGCWKPSQINFERRTMYQPATELDHSWENAARGYDRCMPSRGYLTWWWCVWKKMSETRSAKSNKVCVWVGLILKWYAYTWNFTYLVLTIFPYCSKDELEQTRAEFATSSSKWLRKLYKYTKYSFP